MDKRSIFDAFLAIDSLELALQPVILMALTHGEVQHPTANASGKLIFMQLYRRMYAAFDTYRYSSYRWS